MNVVELGNVAGMLKRVCSIGWLALVGCAAGADRRDPSQVSAAVETPEPPAASTTESGAKPVAPRRPDAGSTEVCAGVAPEGFKELLVARARATQRCYDLALREQPKLEGRIRVNLRVNTDGTVAFVEVVADEIGNEGLRQCVTEVFRSVVGVRPIGGCIDAVIPLNFRKNSDADAGPDAAVPASP